MTADVPDRRRVARLLGKRERLVVAVGGPVASAEGDLSGGLPDDETSLAVLACRIQNRTDRIVFARCCVDV